MAIDWKRVMECSGMAAAGILFVLAFGSLFALGALCIALISALGIVLAMQGWWGVGIPLFVIGLALFIALAVTLFAKIMVWIKER